MLRKMLRVGIREFQINPMKYLDRLPIELTRYDKVVAVLTTPAILQATKPTTEPHVTPRATIQPTHKPLKDMSMFSDKPVEGYKYNAMLGKYIKS